MKVYIPLEFDGNNRGCEGISKGTAQILNIKKENLIGLSSNLELDKKLGTAEEMTLESIKPTSLRWKVFRKLYNHILTPSSSRHLSYGHTYKWFMHQIKQGDVVLSTGGDMLCYGDDNNVVYLSNLCHKRNIESILWGCSFGKENITPIKLDALRKFSAVYTRESLSYEIMKELGLKKVFCFPDPAFVLKSQLIKLPSIFEHDVVGLNVSNFIFSEPLEDSLLVKNIFNLINYILDSSNMNILIIPHVIWDNQDDRIISKIIKNSYVNNDRVKILDIDNLNYLQIRYIISRCRFFIGARTHSVISAYSTYVPTVALGYSIKSRGIAKDVGIDDKYVIDAKHLKNSNQILSAFKNLQSEEKTIHKHLQEFIPKYAEKAYGAREMLQEILKQ